MEIPLTESATIKRCFVFFFAGTVLVIAALAWRSSLYWLLLLVPVCIYGWRVWTKEVQRVGQGAFQALRVEEKGRCFVRTAGSKWRACDVRSYWAGQQFIFMAVKCEGKRWSRNLAISCDALTPDHFRRLKVWLRTRVQ